MITLGVVGISSSGVSLSFSLLLLFPDVEEEEIAVVFDSSSAAAATTPGENRPRFTVADVVVEDILPARLVLVDLVSNRECLLA